VALVRLLDLRLNAHGISVDKDNTQVTALFEDREGNVWVGGRVDRMLRRKRVRDLLSTRLNSESSGAIT